MNHTSIPDMTDETAITPQQDTPSAIEVAGRAANQQAAKGVFEDYRSRRADNTLRSQDADLETWREYLADVGAPVAGDFALDPDAWRGVTWGLVAAFVRWLLSQGYAISTINRKLATVRVYAKLAFQAGVIGNEQHALIKTVTGYSTKESKRVNEKRQDAGVSTRRGDKKAEPTRLSEADAKALKSHPDTPQGRRDAVLMCLLLEHGLRCSEAALLTVDSVNLEERTLKFYRPKVDKVQTHDLAGNTYKALQAWFESGDALPMGPLLRGSRKGGNLTHAGMSERAITARVKALGEEIGIEKLSAHDCRHFWATYWAKRVEKLPRGVFTLQEAGGWNSLAMPRRYVEEAKIANEGMS